MNGAYVRTAVAVLLAVVLCGGASAQQGKWEHLGIGGAGGIFTPAVSPVNPNVMYLCSDMGESYRSADGGKSWIMIDWRQLQAWNKSYACFVGDAALWVTGNVVKISRDQGVTWQSVSPTPLPWQGRVSKLAAFSPGAGQDLVILVGTDSGLWRSADGGKSYQKALDGKCCEIVPLGSKVYATFDTFFTISDDSGKTWKNQDVPALGGKGFVALTGGMEGNGSVLIGTAPGVGILRSTDEGKTWTVTVDKYDNQSILKMSCKQTRIAYATQYIGDNGKVWKTLDGGVTWSECFFLDRNVNQSWVQPSWGYIINGLGACDGDPNMVLLTTQGDFYISRDTGTTWKQNINTPVEVTENGQKVRGYRSIGLEVTSCWRYFFDPFVPDRTFIAYTDIGFARSPDRGTTWIHAVKGCPWSINFYDVAFDPYVKDRMYAACSNRHDIPLWGMVGSMTGTTGGVCVSEDGGATWKVLGTGFPIRPCTSICLDPKSPEGKLTLYAALMEGGVFKSTDGGKTWVNKSNGLGNPGNLHAYMVRVHPKSGDVFCSITGNQTGNQFNPPGGLWKSTDGGNTWTDLTKELGLHWPGGFAFDPDNADVIYLSAATVPGGREGGVYGTTDGGKSWKRLFRDEDAAQTGGGSFVQGFWINVHPTRHECVYLGTETHGLWMSPDAGKTWKRFMDYPYGNATNVTFDPKNLDIMYVASHGGGIWRSNYLP